jgi:hypothetical protein
MKLMSDFKKNFCPMMRWTRFEAPPSSTDVFGWVIVSIVIHTSIFITYSYLRIPINNKDYYGVKTDDNLLKIEAGVFES